jgi:hypothetical protein
MGLGSEILRFAQNDSLTLRPIGSPYKLPTVITTNLSAALGETGRHLNTPSLEVRGWGLGQRICELLEEHRSEKKRRVDGWSSKSAVSIAPGERFFATKQIRRAHPRSLRDLALSQDKERDPKAPRRAFSAPSAIGGNSGRETSGSMLTGCVRLVCGLVE